MLTHPGNVLASSCNQVSLVTTCFIFVRIDGWQQQLRGTFHRSYASEVGGINSACWTLAWALLAFPVGTVSLGYIFGSLCWHCVPLVHSWHSLLALWHCGLPAFLVFAAGIVACAPINFVAFSASILGLWHYGSVIVDYPKACGIAGILNILQESH
jgi:hypothetical protein